jgi:Protein of unknown function (DUF3684)
VAQYILLHSSHLFSTNALQCCGFVYITDLHACTCTLHVLCQQVFVGTETHQTTGTGYHVNGPLFPTMERTSLDLQSTAVATWNKEMLHCCGLLARAYYDIEVCCHCIVYIITCVSFSFHNCYVKTQSAELAAINTPHSL